MDTKNSEALQISDWNGYERLDFTLNGRECIVVRPQKQRPGNPWIWRAEFFSAFAHADFAMVSEGWHLAYCKVSDMYGCPEAVELMKTFYNYVTAHFHLAPKCTIFGFSRGGLYTVNYAAKYPADIACLYLDAPVLDIRSWPAGFGKGKGAANKWEWEKCKEWYGLDDNNVKSFTGNSLDKIDILHKHNIEIILIAGDSDEVVPYEENGAVLARRYQELGGKIKVIVKPGIGHHPHSLEDPKEIVEFIKDNWERCSDNL